MKIIIALLLLTITFSAFATEKETDTNQIEPIIITACSPQPDCDLEISSLNQWIDQLQMLQLMELLKIQQDQPTETTETNND